MKKLGVAQLTTLRIGIENGSITVNDIMQINQLRETPINRNIAIGKAMILETMGLIKKNKEGPGWQVTKLGKEVYNLQRGL